MKLSSKSCMGLPFTSKVGFDRVLGTESFFISKRIKCDIGIPDIQLIYKALYNGLDHYQP